MNLNAIRRQLLAHKLDLDARIARIRQHETRAQGALPQDFAEQATEAANDEVVAGLGVATREELAQVSRALERLDAGQYGTCVVCQQPIDERRLAALPYSDRCVRCAEFHS